MEKYSLENAQAEAEKIERKIESGEASDYDEADHILDKEKSVERAMAKVVDIYSEKDLKYRESWGLFNFAGDLNHGIISPVNKYFFTDDGLSNEEKRKKVREEILREEGYHKFSTANEDEEPRERYFSHSANVYYPEGILNFIKDLLEHPDQKRSDLVYSEFSREIIKKFLDVTSSLANPHGRDATPIISREVIEGIFRVLSTRFSNLERGYRQEVLNTQSLEDHAVEEFLNNFENIRKKWLSNFFTTAMNYGHRCDRGTIIIGSPVFGIVFGSEANVRVSLHDDYPTQASLIDVNNKRDIVGIFINNIKLAYGLASFTATKKAENYDSQISYLKDAHLKVTSKLFFNEFRYLTDREKNETFEKYPNIKAIYNKGTSDWVRNNLTQEEEKEIEQVTRELLTRFTPFKEGQSAWDMIIALSEYHRLPIYNFKGDLLWPQEMSHDELVRFVEKKETTKK